MCTRWTLTRLVRWRVRDWASCFLACRFPLDDERDDYQSTLPQLPIRNMVFEMNGEAIGSSKTNKKLSRKDRSKKERRRLNIGSTTARNTVSMENGSDDSSWPHFQDEDYIVFCFREDGAFDVLKDCQSDTIEHLDPSNRSSRPVNRKLNYSENAETSHKKTHKERTKGRGHAFCLANNGEITPMKEGEENEEGAYSSTELPSSSINRRRYQMEENENHGMLSVGSSDSNQSDCSAASFTFPVLRWEWMGSPAQMPKSEGKHKARCVRFQCCRF